MRLGRIEAFAITGKLCTPWPIASGPINELVAAIVRVEDEGGVAGYGECCCRGGAPVLSALIDTMIAPLLIGREAEDIAAIWDDMYALLRTRGHTRGFMIEAMSGIDIALWDLAGVHAGQSLSRMLMGHGRATLPAYASSVLIGAPETMADEAAALAAQGYDAIKIKVAGQIGPDVERVRAVRSAIGSEAKLMLDANSGFDAAGAIAFCRRIEDQDIYWLEEPLPLDDLPGYRRLRQGTGQRIALGEGEFTTAGFRAFIEDGLIDVVQPNVTRAGGVTGTCRIAALAQAHGLPVALHTGASGPICMAATLQLASALPGIALHEHMYLENPFAGFFDVPLPVPDAGRIAVPGGPGLGARPSDTAIAALSTPARAA